MAIESNQYKPMENVLNAINTQYVRLIHSDIKRNAPVLVKVSCSLRICPVLKYVKHKRYIFNRRSFPTFNRNLKQTMHLKCCLEIFAIPVPTMTV